MAKIKMSKVAGFPVRTLRRVIGVRAHASSAFNACVGAALKGKSYARPPAGMGGQNNPAVRAAFTAATRSCSGKR
jgi:hypothetical protein